MRKTLLQEAGPSQGPAEQCLAVLLSEGMQQRLDTGFAGGGKGEHEARVGEGDKDPAHPLPGEQVGRHPGQGLIAAQAVSG